MAGQTHVLRVNVNVPPKQGVHTLLFCSKVVIYFIIFIIHARRLKAVKFLESASVANYASVQNDQTNPTFA
jgi:hypothetical protein